MSRSTGPILAVGAITFVNGAVLGDQADDLKFGTRVAVGTAIAGMGLAAMERVSDRGAVALAWLALVTVLLVKPPGVDQAPAERALAWWNKTK
jgi:hypothetical protein